MELIIRKLTVGDNRYLIGLLRKLINDLKEDWIENIVKDNDNDKPNYQSSGSIEDEEKKAREIFLMIIDKLLTFYSDEMTIWFSSLLNITIDEYEELPFDTDLIVIEQIMKQDNFKFFFQRACTLFKLQKVYEKLSRIVKERLDSMTS